MKLRLLAGLPIYVGDIPVYSPKLIEIANCSRTDSKANYESKLQKCIIDKSMINDVAISGAKDIEDFDVALMLFCNKDKIIEYLDALHFFTKVRFQTEKIDSDVFFYGDKIKINCENYEGFLSKVAKDKEISFEDVKNNMEHKDIILKDEFAVYDFDIAESEECLIGYFQILNRHNYKNFTNAIKIVNRIETDIELEEMDEFDRQVYEMEKKIKENQKGENISLEDLISSVANMDENGLNIMNIWELTIFVFYEQFQRGQLKEKYKINIQQLLAGADSKDISIEHYIKNINDK